MECTALLCVCTRGRLANYAASYNDRPHPGSLASILERGSNEGGGNAGRSVNPPAAARCRLGWLAAEKEEGDVLMVA